MSKLLEKFMDKVDAIQLLEFQDKLTHKPREEQWRVLYMWIKQDRISLKVYLALSEWILIREANEVYNEQKREADLDGEW